MSALDDYLHMYGRPVAGLVKDAAAELAALRQTIKKARKVIQGYSDYHEGEYEEMPEQKAGRKWLEANPALEKAEETK